MSFVTRISLLSIALVVGLITQASAAVVIGTANGSIVSFQLNATGATTYAMTNFNLGTYSINGVTGDFPTDPSGDPEYTVEDYNVRNFRASIPIGTISFNTASTAALVGDALRFKFNDGINPVVTYDFFSSQITYVSGILNGDSALYLNLYLLGTLVGTDGSNAAASMSFTATKNGVSAPWTASYSLTLPPVAPPVTHDDNPVPEPSSVALLGIGLLALGWARRRQLFGA